MDSDLTGFIIAVIVAVCVGYIESRGKARKMHAKAEEIRAPKSQKPAAPIRQRKPSAQAQRHSYFADEQLPVKPEPFIKAEEGQRVTADTPDEFPHNESTHGLRPLDRDSLRNAVIWGEILKPKF